MNIQHPSNARTLSFSQKLLVLVFGSLFLTMAMGLFAVQPARAASGPRCRVTNPEPITVYGFCDTVQGLTKPEKDLLKTLGDDICVDVYVPVNLGVNEIFFIECTKYSEYATITSKSKTGSQTAADFKKCNDATSKEDGCVAKYISMAIAFLSGGVGIVVVIMIIIGGIQYTSSSGDPQKVGAAKQKIFNAVLALVTWVLLLGFLNYLVPGGIL